MVKNIFNFFKSRENRKTVVSRLIMAVMIVSLLQLMIIYSFFNRYSLFNTILNYCLFGLISLSVILLLDEISTAVKYLWLFLLLSFFVSYLINLSQLDYIFKTFIFLGLLTVLPSIKIDKRIIFGAFILYMFYAVMIAILANKTNEENSLIINELNTNTSTFVCFCAEVVLLAFSFKLNKKYRILCYIAVAFFIVAECIFFGRTSIIATFIVIVCYIFQKFFNKMSNKTIKWITLGLCFGGIIVTLLYLLLFKLLGDGVYIFGKDIFSGREVIWRDALKQVNEYHGWFFGIGDRFLSESHYGSYTSEGLHNQMMSYFIVYGGFVFIAFSLLFSKVVENNSCHKNKFFNAFLFAFIITLYFETFIVYNYTSQNLILTVLFAYLFTKDDEKKDLQITE